MVSALDIIRVVAEMAALGQTILNVWHFVSLANVSDDEAIEDLRGFMDIGYNFLEGGFCDELTFENISMFNVTDNVDMGIHTWPTMTAGTETSQILPLGVAGLVTFPTSTPKVRGRKFLAGFSEGANDNGVFSSALVTALEDFGAYFADALIGGESNELWTAGVPKSTGGFAQFSAALVSNVPSYQRRRKQGVGS